METGRLMFLFLLAAALALLSARLVVWRYRKTMTRLMQAATTPVSDTPATAVPGEPVRSPPAPLSLADNRRALWWLVALLVGLSLLMALTRAYIEFRFVYETEPTVSRLATLALVFAWPVIPVIGLLRRWSRWRVGGLLAAWWLAALALLAWRTTEAVSLAALVQMLSMEIGLPLIVVATLCLGSATRAVGPWLLPPFLVLSWSSQSGLDLLESLVDDRAPLLPALSAWFGVWPVIIGFGLLPWLLAWWPVKWLGHWLARAYTSRHFSELIYLFSAVWGIALFFPALSSASHLGWGGAIVLLPLLWIPLAMLLAPRLRPAIPGRPPTLLVLRVFQQDAAVSALFDQVIERWRLTGNTVLIAGTDLVDRTIDAEDIFTFIDRRLGERFIRSPSEVAPRLAAFELAPDAEGRYRINECYCHDQTWQAALAALVGISDVVLMDLRSFKARNKGCIHELGVLARASGVARVVVLTSAESELPAARDAAGGAPADRFVWLDLDSSRRFQAAQVLAALFPEPSAKTEKSGP
ncbi:hypothetical protein [Dechloromonas sp. A34]|uniref:hypothetical protein n=1 Tax=Dechloromonas sp. A34 TaxID=447588 RepID=UPI002249125B|nr:hypothetical protein [Dechloromonas sp. A34]